MFYKFLIALLLLVGTFNASAQAIYDVNFETLSFLAANMTFKTGTNGTTVGAKTLYTNVITIGGQQIDCIVTTISLSGGTFSLPSGAAAATYPFDYSATSATYMASNANRYFSPTFNFTSAGSCKFSFQFILGGSYNNSTNTGTNVILKNLQINSYDIDGNGSARQYNEFGGFYCSSLKTTSSNISVSYNSSTGLTKYSSISTDAVTNILDPINRVSVLYDFISTFEIVLGATGSGENYYFLDFSNTAWSSPATQTCNPSLDLNTTTSGLNNENTTCGGTVNLDFGATNYSNSSGSVDEIVLTFNSSSIADGNAEMLIPTGSSGGLADKILLGFSSSSNQTFTLGGITFQAQKSVTSGVSTIKFVKNGGGVITSAQTESLLDALQYRDTASTKIAGIRSFSVKARELSFFSPTAAYNVTVDCTVLPIILNSFEGKCRKGNIMLDWTTSFESNNMGFIVERSTDAVAFEPIGFIKSLAKNGNSHVILNYFFIDSTAKDGSYYRLSQIDFDGKRNNSRVIYIYCNENIIAEVIYPNPARGQINLAFNNYSEQQLLIQFIDQLGVTKFIEKISIKKGLINRSFSIKHLSPGLYYMKIFSQDTNGHFIKPFVVF